MITGIPAWRLRDGVTAVAIGIVASGVAGTVLAGGGLTGLEIFAVVLPAQSFATLGTIAVLARGRGRLVDTLGLRVRWIDLVGLPVGVGVQIVLSTLAYAIVETFFDGEVPGQEVVDLAGATAGAFERTLAVFGLVLLGPIAEEVVFRGLILPALMPRGRRFAVVASSAAFALLHLLDPRALFAVPFLFILSIVIANETLRTGRLGRAIAIHAGFNLVTVFAVFVAS